jgi:hypothetical protein
MQGSAGIPAGVAFGKEFSMSRQNVEVAREPETSPGNSPGEPGVEPYTNPFPDEKEIAELAYRRWVEKGCPQQSAEDDWFEAERDLRLRNPNGQ